MSFKELAEKGIWTQAMSEAAKKAVVLLCSPGTDTSLENLTRNARLGVLLRWRAKS